MVKVEVGLVPFEGVTDVGLKLQLTALTPELQVSATPLLNPFSAATVTVEVAEFPDPPSQATPGWLKFESLDFLPIARLLSV